MVGKNCGAPVLYIAHARMLLPCPCAVNLIAVHGVRQQTAVLPVLECAPHSAANTAWNAGWERTSNCGWLAKSRRWQAGWSGLGLNDPAGLVAASGHTGHTGHRCGRSASCWPQCSTGGQTVGNEEARVGLCGRWKQFLLVQVVLRLALAPVRSWSSRAATSWGVRPG